MTIMDPLATAWGVLEQCAANDRTARIADHFTAEPDRLQRLSAAAAGVTLDLSKQSWSLSGFDAALDLARAAGVDAAKQRLFGGEVVNPTEGRPALHMALRAVKNADFKAQGKPVMADVEAVRARMKTFADGVRSGAIPAADGQPFTSILHIGIGGSDLGPRLVWDALRPLKPAIDLKFVANVDGDDLALACAALDPARTLVVIASKTFTTQETMANAQAAKAWLAAAVGETKAGTQMAAVSTALDKTAALGIADDRVFGFWDWVGGRYSLWSSVGLSCAVALGWDVFDAFLAGAARMDAHFRDAPLEANLPVLLALAQVYNRNGLGRASRSVVPYAHRLRRLPSFLQQLEMESNGKSVTLQGEPVAHGTAPVVFGGEGSNVQHAYFQGMHQGTDIVPTEIVAIARAGDGSLDMHAKLLSNALAQAEALMVGRSEAPIKARLFAGNRPSSFILLDRLDPAGFGALIALYEHKTFVEGVIWNIDSFDQWGVELGKEMGNAILDELQGGTAKAHDPSTAALIERLKN
jgi:glucose-6-phosphate isomerase